MTPVELHLRLALPPTAAVAAALARVCAVYGIRSLRLDSAPPSLLLEYDATRLSQATVLQLLRRSGLQLGEQPQAPLPLSA